MAIHLNAGNNAANGFNQGLVGQNYAALDPTCLKFNVGDTVTLNSGGPALTVEACDYGNEQWHILVAWFDGATLKRDEFPGCGLRKVDAPSAG